MKKTLRRTSGELLFRSPKQGKGRGNKQKNGTRNKKKEGPMT